MNTLEISKDVLIGIATLTLEHVKGIEPINPAANMGEVLTGKRMRGIKADREGNQVRFDITLNIDYGLSILKVAQEVQNAVIENVELMTGLKVQSVHITVHNIVVPKAS